MILIACSDQRPRQRGPVARIEGATLRAGYGALVTLDGSGSSDPDGDPLTYRWRFVSGPDVSRSIRHANRPRMTFTTRPASDLFPLRPLFGPLPIPRWGEATYEIELAVSDGASEDRTLARVRSAAVTGGWPRAETGLDLTVYCGDREDTPARWRLAETPAASKALVLEPERCLARVRADRNGHYLLREETSGRSIRFWYGDWVGHEECGRPECHPVEHDGWKNTKHASVFERGIEGGLGAAYGPECAVCHVLGSDPATRSIGFRRAAEVAGWEQPTLPRAGAADEMPAGVRLWANVQCEQCHGPGRFWTGLSAEPCAQCHDAPPRYLTVSQWRRSPMSVPPAGLAAARADCASCHTAHGAIGRIRGRPMAAPKEEPVAQAVTCPVCHEPHAERGRGQLRLSGLVDFSGRSVAAGQSAVCFACHGQWDGGDPAKVPHAPQAYVLLGAARGSRPPHAGVTHLCVGCHMFHEPGKTDAGGHTFSLASGREPLDGACRGCHPDARGLRIRGGLAERQLAEETDRLMRRVRAAVVALEVRGCDGSPAVDLAAKQGRMIFLDALGRTVMGCGGEPLAAPAGSDRVLRAATLLAIVSLDGSEGAHNAPFARALLREGMALLGGPAQAP
ncbi:MAG: cytochrome c3 family protein [Deltaproteobacteria bacterium]|nr:cytochrome c3 family protein [Deltaproteobacteria bacterium]